ncbi:hypothetical protein ISN45_Aa07g031080 [Arabidopsis thaliana x Arabidopsis arenosa]|uniref:Uncharacterized protein n=2 Tax=Arabidopsis TaxID=3701 RepID=A0A8T1ZW23_ARASU|nr:hypothetical protein ISN45_Aa07g031080 [Arabidopsis thaliana x Arabidopsis arenosa]KAG7564194.1 hypothetical protein ISN44_As10g009620 [Arabidopsis suecica]
MIHFPSLSLVSDTLNHSFRFRWLEAPNHLRRSVLQLRQPPPSLSFSIRSAGVRRIASLLACLLLNIVWCSVLKILPSKSLTRIRVEKRYSLSLVGA